MHQGWISRLRRIRRATAQVVAVAMLLPALFSLLPQPALSAAAQLEQDLARALCSESGSHSTAPEGHAGHEGSASCILCAACASAGSTGLSGAAGGVSLALPERGMGQRLAAQRPRQHLPAPSGGSPPRGPPFV